LLLLLRLLPFKAMLLSERARASKGPAWWSV
jgi:hypothetical protein